MVDTPAALPVLVLLTLCNVNANKLQRCNFDWRSGQVDEFLKPIKNNISNVSSFDAPPTLSVLQSSMNPLQIKSMSTKIKTVSVPSKRKRRLAPLIPPLLPPLIPPIIPPIPFLPLPILPLIPPPILTLVPKIVNPIKSLQKLKRKTALEKTLKSIGKDKAVKLPGLDLKKNILEKLLDLKKKGSLTTAEFIRFKKLLLH